MGHIQLRAPIVHPWAFRHTPCYLALLLGHPVRPIRDLVYHHAHIVFSSNKKSIDNYQIIDSPTALAMQHENPNLRVETGATALLRLLRALDLNQLAKSLRADLSRTSESAATYARRRLRIIEWFRQSGNRPEWLILTHLPVIPVGLRPAMNFQRDDREVDGNRTVQQSRTVYSTSDLNELYRRVLQVNDRLAKYQKQDAPALLLSEQTRQLQRAVDGLLDNAISTKPIRDRGGRPLQSLADRLGGKKGRFRSSMLGKRVDYSGRAVIVVGPQLQLHQCGLPWSMIYELFQPFLARALIQHQLARNLKHALRVILPELKRTDYVAYSHPILLDDLQNLHAERNGHTPSAWSQEASRQASLERLRDLGPASYLDVGCRLLTENGITAASEWLIGVLEGRQHEFHQLVARTIRTHPVLLNRAPTLHRLSIQAFEPIPVEGNAIQLHPAVCKAFAADFDGDQMAVHVPLSFEAQIEARILMMTPNNLISPANGQPIAVPTQDVVLGCAMLTAAPTAPNSVPHPYIDANEIHRAVATQQCRWHDRVIVRHAGERRVTTAGRVLFHTALPPGTPFRDEVMTSSTLTELITTAHHAGGAGAALRMLESLQRIGLWAATRSGATFALSDLPNIPIDWPMIDRLVKLRDDGLISSSEYDDMLLRAWGQLRSQADEKLQQSFGHPLSDGPNPLGVMVASRARGSIDQMRQLAAARGPVNRMSQRGNLPIVRHGYREGLSPLEYFASASGGRKSLADKGLSTAQAGELTRRLVYAAQRIIIREADCGSAHGLEMPTSDAAGRVALQNIERGGERFVRAGKIIWPATVVELLERQISTVIVRSPLTCDLPDGAVCQRCYGSDPSTGRLVEMGAAIGVTAAQSIGEPGTQFTMRLFHSGGVASGSDLVDDLKRVRRLLEGNCPAALQALETEGIRASQQILLDELRRIYRGQHIDIAEQHLEVIVRQMFRLVEVVNSGQTTLVPGQLIERSILNSHNQNARRKATCRPRLCGLKRIIQEADGFLSAASFQETVNILFAAALAGRQDRLTGLKEHILIGGRIPAGTGQGG